MKRNIERYFFFLFFFVFALSLVNISPLFAKKEKEADKTAVDTDVCKKDTTKTGAEQYSAKCKEQCTSTDEKFAKFKEDNKEACTLLQALTATTTDKPAITREQQEIESLVQDVVEKLNKIEDTAENTAALEAIIPDYLSQQVSKEFTITFSDKLRAALEAIIFAQPAPEPPTATIALYNVLNEATDKTPETPEKTPGTTPETPEKTPSTTPETPEKTPSKTPIQVRAEAAIKTIILKSFDPLTDTTGKYYKEVIQELRDHWLNVDLKGDATTKDTPFTVDNFKSAIFGSIGYSLPHELYHFEFDEALTKAIKDHAEADTAKKAFVEAYKKYIETNTKIEIQSNSWEEGKSLEFKISLKAGDALLDPSTKCTSTDEKSAQFQKDNTEVCKLVADATAKAANQEVCKLVANKTGLDQYSETCKTQCTSTDATFAQFQTDNADICKLIAVAAKAANQEVCKLVANKTGLDQYSEPCKTQCTSTDATFAQFQEDNKEACKLVADATAKAANQEVCKLVANKTGLDQYSETCRTQCISTDATFAQFQTDNADICKLIAVAAKAANQEVCKLVANKTGLDQYSEPCKTQCTSTDEKFAQFQKDNAEVCKLVADAKAVTDSGTGDADSKEQAKQAQILEEEKAEQAKQAQIEGEINAIIPANLSTKEAYDKIKTVFTGTVARIPFGDLGFDDDKSLLKHIQYTGLVPVRVTITHKAGALEANNPALLEKLKEAFNQRIIALANGATNLGATEHTAPVKDSLYEAIYNGAVAGLKLTRIFRVITNPLGKTGKTVEIKIEQSNDGDIVNARIIAVRKGPDTSTINILLQLDGAEKYVSRFEKLSGVTLSNAYIADLDAIGAAFVAQNNFVIGFFGDTTADTPCPIASGTFFAILKANPGCRNLLKITVPTDTTADFGIPEAAFLDPKATSKQHTQAAYDAATSKATGAIKFFIETLKYTKKFTTYFNPDAAQGDDHYLYASDAIRDQLKTFINVKGLIDFDEFVFLAQNLPASEHVQAALAILSASNNIVITSLLRVADDLKSVYLTKTIKPVSN